MSKRVFVREHPCGNLFRLHVHFHAKGFARRLVLKLRHKIARKWPIVVVLQAMQVTPYGIGPMHDPVTWYKITHALTQFAQWDFQNKATRTSRLWDAFVLEFPPCNLRPSMCEFVPCDWIVQRAYCFPQNMSRWPLISINNPTYRYKCHSVKQTPCDSICRCMFS